MSGHILNEPLRRKLIAAVRLLDSAHDGEALAALNAVRRLLHPTDKTLGDLVEAALVPPARVLRPDFSIVRSAQAAPAELLRDWQRKGMAVLAQANRLTDVEREFARNMTRARFEPTGKQVAWLDDLAAKVAA